MRGSCLFRCAVVALLFAALAVAQQTGNEQAISLKTRLPLKAFLRQLYNVQLTAQGGATPYTWQVAEGEIPPGLSLGGDGVLGGTPSAVGEFRFVVTIVDSGHPAHQRNQEIVLRVLAPLLAQWSQPPKIVGRRIEGSIKVSNQSEDEFDLTIIVLAVNEIGRATAISYQHFPLKPGTTDMEIPFGENLSKGAYEINTDVVAEVAATNTIHRARLVTPEKLQVKQGP